MKKSAILFGTIIFAAGFVFAGTAKAGDNKTIDKPASVFPAKKRKDGKKKKPPVTFNHKKHGENKEGCTKCHHKEDLKAGDTKAKSCWDSSCHGPEEKMVEGKTQLDGWDIVHDKKNGRCVKCHKESGKEEAPTKCKDCHKE